MQSSVQVLFVDDQVKLYETELSGIADSSDYTLSFSSFGTDAISQAKDVDVLVLDLEYPGQERDIARKLGLSSSLSGPEVGIAILEFYSKYHPEVGVIIVTQNPSEQAVGRCFQLGAIQYLDKEREGGLDCFQLAQEIKNTVELVQDRKARRVFEESGDAGEEFITRSPKIRSILKEAARLAGQQLTVLLLGESGVGKDRMARFIHRFSNRAQRPYVAINLGTLDKELLGSELFGHVRGAFTGAMAERQGLFGAASGGTIFLDEIGEASQDVQVGLLRVLQEGELRRVGSNQNEKIDVRVIAATNRDLDERVKAGLFREDLYYRLNQAPIIIPPLRERPEDIPALANYFVTRYCNLGRQPVKELSVDAVEALCGYEWRGNVRQLESVIMRTVALTPKITIRKEDLSLPESDKSLGGYASLVDELAVSLTQGDSSARRFMNDLDILVYDRLYQKLGAHSKVAKLWGKDDDAMTAQRQRWAESLAKEIFSGARSEEDVPVFLKDVCEKYLRKLAPLSGKS